MADIVKKIPGKTTRSPSVAPPQSAPLAGARPQSRPPSANMPGASATAGKTSKMSRAAGTTRRGSVPTVRGRTVAKSGNGLFYIGAGIIIGLGVLYLWRGDEIIALLAGKPAKTAAPEDDDTGTAGWQMKSTRPVVRAEIPDRPRPAQSAQEPDSAGEPQVTVKPEPRPAPVIKPKSLVKPAPEPKFVEPINKEPEKDEPKLKPEDAQAKKMIAEAQTLFNQGAERGGKERNQKYTRVIEICTTVTNMKGVSDSVRIEAQKLKVSAAHHQTTE